MEHASEYTIRTIHAAPSMNLSSTPFTGTFADAVDAARAQYTETGRTTYVCGKHGLPTWFSITSKGEENRNRGAIYRAVA
jgi:hypothetical protein